jgi:hypothetical protein
MGTEHNIEVLLRISKFSAVRGRRPGVIEASPLDAAHLGNVRLFHDIDPELCRKNGIVLFNATGSPVVNRAKR